LAVRMRDLFADSLDISRLGSTNAIPRDTLKFQLNNPLISLNAELIKVTNKDSMRIPATTWIDESYNIASIIFDKTDEQQYTIEILPNAFIDFFENTNDTLTYRMRTLEVSDYGELSMALVNVKKYPIIVELVDSNYKVVESRYLTENTPLYFNYLEPDQYYFRIIYDENLNKIWDTGIFLEKIQPEKVIYLPKQIEIRPNFYINETFTLD